MHIRTFYIELLIKILIDIRNIFLETHYVPALTPQTNYI